MIFFKATPACTLPALMLAFSVWAAPEPATAGTEPYVGEIVAMGILNFCPVGWLSAEGQLLQISENDVLYTLLGTAFGGDGNTTFGLPDLRGRLPLGTGTGQGLSPRTVGQSGGQETVVLGANQLAAHSHLVNATNADGDLAGPGDKLLAAAPPNGAGQETIYSDQPANVVMSSQMIAPTGGSQPVNVQDPSLVIRYCIAVEGIYPSQS